MDHQECEGLRDLRERGESLASLARWDLQDQPGFKVLLDPSVRGESGGSLALSDLRVLPASEVEKETRDRLETRESREYPDLLDLRYPGYLPCPFNKNGLKGVIFWFSPVEMGQTYKWQ